MTAESLGIERNGNGVVIDKHHILTIGYIVLEAEKIDVSLFNGKTIPAKVVGYDHTTGFGLLKPIIKTELSPLKLGDSDKLKNEEWNHIGFSSKGDPMHEIWVKRK